MSLEWKETVKPIAILDDMDAQILALFEKEYVDNYTLEISNFAKDEIKKSIELHKKMIDNMENLGNEEKASAYSNFMKIKLKLELTALQLEVC